MVSTPFVRRAFTLVELLVVIGIIAVLIAILLPAISKARSQANTTACLSNLRNLGQAIAVYKAEYKGAYPYAYYTGGVSGSGATQEEGDAGDRNTYVWWSILRGTMRGRGAPMDNSVVMTNGAEATRFMEAFNCPIGLNRNAGCDFMANAAVFINWNDEKPNSPNRHPLNFHLARPMNDRLVPADVVLLWDAPELAFVTDPPYGRQYVHSYGIDTLNYPGFGGMIADPKKTVWRYRGLNPDNPAEGDAHPISPGTNSEVTAAGGAGTGGIRWRHKRNDSANFLFADGSVKPMDINKRVGTTNTYKGEVIRKMFRPKMPPGMRPINF